MHCLFSSQYDCAGSARINVLAQDVAVVPSTRDPAFGFCFPLPILAGHIAQHVAECKVHAVVVLPAVRALCFRLVQLPAIGSIEVAPVSAVGFFELPTFRWLPQELEVPSLEDGRVLSRLSYCNIRVTRVRNLSRNDVHAGGDSVREGKLPRYM